MHAESKNRLEKKAIVNEIKNKFNTIEGFYIAEYRGLSVAQMTDLRFKAQDLGVDIKVYKNRLVKQVTSKSYTDLDEYLVGPNIFVFAQENAIAGAKLLKSFAKDNPDLVIKAGIYENKVIDAQGVLDVAGLPTYEEALTILANSLLSPLKQVALSFKLLADENKLPAE
ncbi:50S ribosomal protein L10 [Mycoplasmopsis agassizii]|uniref:Large ribosomal subunit protein uL10 n=1 Tax=Mycoplasmopsis agassizii TaxID=33922 RepID=A0ABX4H3W7_9BACT|nr:50S ribosomal protein L10 [Mycoplasmopsis agassizii]PAF54606.1 50S ribosomal protein L10 [Mycoplasmopsis agassizii]SMC19415.1 LSU ribosomal protein L10P [Mycoplasmopsis agassizii]